MDQADDGSELLRHHAHTLWQATRDRPTGWSLPLAAARTPPVLVTVYDDAWVLSNASGNCTAGQACTFQATATLIRMWAMR
jgi:hypothetical protein